MPEYLVMDWENSNTVKSIVMSEYYYSYNGIMDSEIHMHSTRTATVCDESLDISECIASEKTTIF